MLSGGLIKEIHGADMGYVWLARKQEGQHLNSTQFPKASHILVAKPLHYHFNLDLEYAFETNLIKPI